MENEKNKAMENEKNKALPVLPSIAQRMAECNDIAEKLSHSILERVKTIHSPERKAGGNPMESDKGVDIRDFAGACEVQILRMNALVDTLREIYDRLDRITG